MIMPYVAGFGVHGVFWAPIITDVLGIAVAIGMMRTELKKMNQDRRLRSEKE